MNDGSCRVALGEQPVYERHQCTLAVAIADHAHRDAVAVVVLFGLAVAGRMRFRDRVGPLVATVFPIDGGQLRNSEICT